MWAFSFELNYSQISNRNEFPFQKSCILLCIMAQDKKKSGCILRSSLSYLPTCITGTRATLYSVFKSQTQNLAQLLVFHFHSCLLPQYNKTSLVCSSTQPPLLLTWWYSGPSIGFLHSGSLILLFYSTTKFIDIFSEDPLVNIWKSSSENNSQHKKSTNRCLRRLSDLKITFAYWILPRPV